MRQALSLRGFTLFELLLAISLGLILLMIAVPSYEHLLARNKTTGVVNHIIAAIHTARSEAITQSRVIVFCGSEDNTHCDGQWQAGQLMLIDDSQQVLRIYSGISPGDRLWWKSSLGYNNALKFAPTGFTQGQRGSFYYCPRYRTAQYGAKIVVSDSGRVRVETDAEELQKICVSV